MSLFGSAPRALSDDELIALAHDLEAEYFERVTPPPHVWDNIAAELGFGDTEHGGSAHRGAMPIASPSWFSPARLLSIAAATLLMVGVAVAVVTNAADDSAVTEVAAAMMTDEGLPVATTATADAVVLCEDDGCYVEVTLSALPDAGEANLELWVITSDIDAVQSLGNITTIDGRFDLPAGVSADDYPIVDISIEPNDGDETHSGQSVLRGTFDQP